MALPTEAEIRAYQAEKHAEREAELAANPPAGSAGFTYDKWSRLTFGDQAYYRRGQSDPSYEPDVLALRAMAGVIADTPRRRMSGPITAENLLSTFDAMEPCGAETAALALLAAMLKAMIASTARLPDSP